MTQDAAPSSAPQGGGPTTEALRAYVERARWFGGKGRAFQITGVRLAGHLPGVEPTVRIHLVELTYDDDAAELYQIPLAYYRDAVPRLDHAFVEWVEDPELGWTHAYDALHDREAMGRWLEAFVAAGEAGESGEASTLVEGDLTFHRLPGHELDATAHSTLFSGEQSNSSVRFGDDSMMKVFRKVTPGVNPDVEIHEALSTADSDHIATLYGWLSATPPPVEPTPSVVEPVETPDGGVLHLAMLQQFLRTASDGWDLAQASVRNLLAEADLHADEVGGDFEAESARLGEAVAEVHTSLLTLGTESADTSGITEQMGRRLLDAVDVVPALSAHAEQIQAVYARVAALGEQEVQRVHGDLHLGQTLRTTKGWKLVDFEGEPAKPLAERVVPDSRWRDVAGMLRSFDYAAHVVERTMGGGHPESARQMAYRAREWVTRNQSAFLAAYAGRDLTADERALLAAYVADKAVYEAVYETRNRPTWVDIPLMALARVAGE